VKTASAYKTLWDGDKQFLSAIAKEVATLVAVPENMNYFRKQITEFADKWRAYKTAYEADRKGKWQPSMGRPSNPLGTIWPSVYGSGWRDGVENFLPEEGGIYYLSRYYPCRDIKIVLGACALLAVINDNILPHCPPIAKGVLSEILSQEIWRNLVTGVGAEGQTSSGGDEVSQQPRSVIRSDKIASFLIDVRADIGQDATALSEIEKLYFNKFSPTHRKLWDAEKERQKQLDNNVETDITPQIAKGADTNTVENRLPSPGASYIPPSTDLRKTWRKAIQNAEGQKDYLKSNFLNLVLYANELGCNASEKQLDNLQKIDVESSFRREAEKVKNEIKIIIKQLPVEGQLHVLGHYENLSNYVFSRLRSCLKNNIGGFLDVSPGEQERTYKEVVDLSEFLTDVIELYPAKDTDTQTGRVQDDLDSTKPEETKQNVTPAKCWGIIKRIPRWIFKKTSHFILTVIVAIFVAVIAAIAVDIFADFGWLQSIKAFIYSILWRK
jgi:hypothetical protein